MVLGLALALALSDTSLARLDDAQDPQRVGRGERPGRAFTLEAFTICAPSPFHIASRPTRLARVILVVHLLPCSHKAGATRRRPSHFPRACAGREKGDRRDHGATTGL